MKGGISGSFRQAMEENNRLQREAIEQSEQIDLRASKYGQSTGSGKIADLD